MKNLVQIIIGLIQTLLAVAELIAVTFSVALSLVFAVVLLVITGAAGLLVLVVLAFLLSVIQSNA